MVQRLRGAKGTLWLAPSFLPSSLQRQPPEPGCGARECLLLGQDLIRLSKSEVLLFWQQGFCIRVTTGPAWRFSEDSALGFERALETGIY